MRPDPAKVPRLEVPTNAAAHTAVQVGLAQMRGPASFTHLRQRAATWRKKVPPLHSYAGRRCEPSCCDAAVAGVVEAAVEARIASHARVAVSEENSRPECLPPATSPRGPPPFLQDVGSWRGNKCRCYKQLKSARAADRGRARGGAPGRENLRYQLEEVIQRERAAPSRSPPLLNRLNAQPGATAQLFIAG